MKSLFLGLGIVLSLTSVQAEERFSRGGVQGTFVVSEAYVDDLDQTTQCVFRVNVADSISDLSCANNIDVFGTCESAIESAIFIDDSCSLQVGETILSTTDQYYAGDLRSVGLFTWIQLNA